MKPGAGAAEAPEPRAELQPQEAPAPSQAPAETPAPLGKILIYVLASSIIALSQSLSMGFVSANVPQLAGDLHATTIQATWVMAAFLAPRASMSLMLIKIRTQFGLRRFAEIGILCFFGASFLNFWVDDLHSAIIVALISGIAAAPLSSLAILYMLEHLPAKYKLSVGLSVALTMIMAGRPLARMLLPFLSAPNGWVGVTEFEIGMAMIALAFVYLLPLTPKPLEKVIAPLDFLSFGLIATGFGGLVVASMFGAYDYWTQTRWIGVLLAYVVLSLVAAAAIELNRKEPLVDLNWVFSPTIFHLACTLLLFRILLSEQSAGVVGMFRTFGLVPDQQIGLWGIVTLATAVAGGICALFTKAERAPLFHAISLVLIAAGAFLDSHSTVLTRPEQMYFSQALIGLASILFLPPAMAKGLASALAKGPNYLLSFVIVFLATQSLGGVVGSGLYRTFVIERTAYHAAQLSPQISTANPQLAGQVQALAAQYAPTISDGAMRKAGAMQQIGASLSQQSSVLAYNDSFLLVCWLALAALAGLILHVCMDAWFARHPARGAAPSLA
ncbi:MFS transporter [Thioclava dalianensis]|uniref:MFS transporter n=1 Tax=Thioclava dalianensis TaxID=1185766 RepID=UPI001FDF2552|nr:MFS transporter [Thioclava dalianensis]